MKRTLSLVLAVVMVCSVVLSALPGMVSAETAPAYRWSLREELAKAATNAGVTDQADFSTSVFKLQYLSGGSFVNLKYATKPEDGKEFTFSANSATVIGAGNSVPSQSPWKCGFVVQANGAITSGNHYKSGKMRIAFEAPVDGTYYIDPIAVNSKGVTAVARAYDCAVKIYTDLYDCGTIQVRTTVNAYNDTFSLDGAVWVDLKKGESIYLEIDPQAADNDDGTNEWINGGVGVTMNFDIVLDEAAATSTTYQTVYNPKDLIENALPKQAYKTTSQTNIDSTVSDVVTGSWYRWANEIPAATFNMESKNSWDQPKWGSPIVFRKTESGVTFAYTASGFNVNQYYATVSKTSNAITMTSWATAVAWRMVFAAPATKTYYIDMGSMTISAATKEHVTFKIYKSSALDSNGYLASDAKALVTYNFYENRTDSWSPCEDELIPVSLSKGEKLYFEIQYDKGCQDYGTSGNYLIGKFSLSIKADPKTVNNVINNDIKLDKSSYEFNGSNTSFNLTATGVSGANVGTGIYWYSTDPKVATVDQSGKVTKVGTSGSCKIVAGNAFDETSCYVKIGDITEIDSVALNKSSVTIDEYSSETLTYTVSPSGGDAKAVEWTSDDESVVRVNDGRLIFVSAGTANVTVNVDGKTAICVVTAAYHDCASNASWKTEDDAKCEETGVESKACSKCRKVLETRDIPEKGHDTQEVIEVYPTWESEGRKTVICNRTGCSYEENITLPVGIVSEVEIVGELEKKIYDYDEEFEPAGITFVVHYSNYEHTTDIDTTDGITFNYDFSADAGDGIREVTFVVLGRELTIEVMVSEGGMVVLGDADNDNEVTTADTIAILRFIAGYDVTIRPKNADINGDGNVDIADVVLLLQYIAGYEIAGIE